MVDFFFFRVLPPILYRYERYFMFRLKQAWGIANLRKVKQKGTNVSVMGYTRFLDPDHIVLGDNVRIGYNCFLFGKGGITIGDNTILSRNITIYSSNHDYNGGLVPYDANYIHKPVVIGKGVWIGMGVSIAPGVTIGDGAIIGMGAVIAKDILPGDIVVGAGQRVVASRDMAKFTALQAADKIFSVYHPES